ncbi:Sulfatase [compost metagenome]
MYWKGHIVPRKDDQFLGSIPDIYPTLLELMGLKNKTPKGLDGKSYAQYYLTGTGKMPSEQFILGTISSDNVKNTGFRGIRTKDYKLAYVKKNQKGEFVLYDLKTDPFEMKNIYDPNHKMVKKLKPVLSQWLQKTGDGFLLGKE